MTVVVLQRGRDRSVRRRHPWIRSDAVARVDGPAEVGARVRVLSAEGEPLGFGHLSPRSHLRVRMLWFGKESPPEGLLEARIAAALARRAASPLLRDCEGLRLINARTLTALGRGQTPGPEASITKVVSAAKQQEISTFGMDLLELGGTLVGDDTPAHGLFQAGYLASPGIRIAGGSDEILRNVIAERVLQLPGDIRVDRDVPFSDIPTGNA